MSNKLSNTMTKAELINEVERLREELDDLQCELDGMNEAYGELENELYDLANNPSAANSIFDLEKFKQRMIIDGVYTESIGDYIENYLRFYN